MDNIIKNFYEKNNTPDFLIKKKLKIFEENEDIADEFRHWLQTGEYNSDKPVVVENYTAKKLSELSPYLSGEGAFIMLIELRQTPEKAIKKLKRGFKMK